MSSKSIIGMACIFICSASLNAGATIILDQVNDAPHNSNYNGTATSLTWQQGVTVGATGLLTSIDLDFAGAGTLDFFINIGSPWQVDANDYQNASQSVVAGWNNIDVSSANIFINAGDEFIIGITGLGIGHPDPWGTTITDQYTGGNLYLNGASFSGGSSDFNFRTYVDVSAVPVPAAAWLFGTGLIGLIGVAKRSPSI